MKKLKYILALITMAGLLHACDLERFPLTSLSEETFWDNEKNAELALPPLYRGGITDGVEYNPTDWWSYHGMIFMEHISDNAFDRRGEANGFFKLSNGTLTADNGFLSNYWNPSYSRIGKCNRFLEGIQKLADSPKKTRMIAEARFLRATQYFYLASYFKDVPLVEKSLTGEEANNVKKTSQADILKWCANEFTQAAVDLPGFTEVQSGSKGRACKQASLAFLGRTYMLMKDWTNGAKAFKEIMDLGENAINDNYEELFYPKTGAENKENIYYIQYMEGFFGCGLPQQALSAKDGGWSLTNPTAGLFEAYEFKDGTPFSYDDPRYDPDNLGKDRDPRLDYTIYYNGATFRGTVYNFGPDGDDSKKEQLNYSAEASKSGYMMRKYFIETEPINNIASYSAVTPVIRYAEVLLGYLECMVESGQPVTQDILDQSINAVRGRKDVDMPRITETSQDKLREIVRHERRVELAMEGIRYWDLMRWGIAHEALSQDIWGAPYPHSVRYATTTQKIDPTGKCRWYVGTRAFRNPQDYTWPIPQSEQNINPNLRD